MNRQDKLKLALDRIKEERKKYKKAKRAKDCSEMKASDKIFYLKQRVTDLKKSEEILIQDLTAQQKCQNEALKSLDNLTEKMDEDKVEMKKEMEERHSEMILKEKEKVKYLMSIIEMLNKRVEDFNKLEEELMSQIEELKLKDGTISEKEAEVKR